MFDQLEAIRCAAQALAVRDPEMTDPLLHACERIWKQIYESRTWPDDLAEKAGLLAQKLSAGGSIESTVDSMNEQEATALGREIVQFASDIQIAEKVRV